MAAMIVEKAMAGCRKNCKGDSGILVHVIIFSSSSSIEFILFYFILLSRHGLSS